MNRTYDVIVIGGGVVGMWTALQAARSGRSVGLLERCDRLGTLGRLRNSGVLHGGLSYVPGSLKAHHCVRGRRLSTEFLQAQGVPYAICGKYIVPAATLEQGKPIPASEGLEELERLRDQAQANDVEEVAIRSSDRSFLYPGWVLHVGCTGIVDLPAYMEALTQAVRQSGVEVFLNRTCVSAEAGRVFACNADTPTIDEEFAATTIVNAAGLYADEVARMFGLSGFEVRPNKGSYFQLRAPLPVQTLVYPLPSHPSGFLGIHYTPDMQGRAWAGPNTSWAESKSDFTPEANRAEFFGGLHRIVRHYEADALIETDKVGLRPRLFENGTACTDFVIREHPVGVCHLLGIESPGLTSAPSLALEVLGRMGAL